MTFVKGTTTWANLTQDLTRLICGEIADGSAVTVASGDRWVREQSRSVTDGVLNSSTTVTSATASFTAADVGSRVFGTGISGNTVISSVTNATTVVLSVAATATASGVTLQICTDAIRTPGALDISTGAISNRTGYFAPYYMGSGVTPGTAATTSLRVTAPFTTDPSTSGFHRWYVVVSINAVNTVAGNYSNATFGYQYYDADSGNLVLNNSVIAFNAAGVATLTNGLQITVADPSGFVQNLVQYRRAFFGPTYMYGIDHWPTYSRRTAAGSFSVAPPGAAGTDYDILDLVPATGSISGISSERGWGFTGLGIRTATGLGSGALYTLSYPMAYAKGRIFNSVTQVGQLALDVGAMKVDTINGNVQRVSHGIRTTAWARVFQTPASVTSSSAVQYWISVKGTGITLALQGDPGFSGKLTTAYFGDFTPYDATYDVMPIMFNGGFTDYTADTGGNDGTMNFERGYWRLRRSQDGSEAPRDWQTKWMRSDFGIGDSYGGGISSDLIAVTTGMTLTAQGYTTGVSGSTYGYAPARQNKPVPVDGKWWFYGFQFGEINIASNAPGTINELRFLRGYQNSRYLYLPSDAWGSGDELTDTSTSAKYLLLIPDYLAMSGRMRVATNTYFGGIAIAEL